jgi:signal transduction histidine kinase
MSERSARRRMRRLSQELSGANLPRVWGRRSFWQIRLRWWVPPLILGAVLVARLAGFGFAVGPVLFTALGILLYNLLLTLGVRRLGADLERQAARDRGWAIVEVALDYGAMFLLVYFTGGLASPLIFFFLFHIIFAAIQFTASTAYGFASLSVFGLWLLALLQLKEGLPSHPLLFRGQALDLLDYPGHLLALLIVFSATAITTAMLTTRIMVRLRRRVGELTAASQHVLALNERFHSLYAMLRAIGSQREPQAVLDLVCRELKAVMEVRVVAVKLLSADGHRLNFVAAEGLSTEFLAEQQVQLAESPLNRRVIAGETLVEGDIDADAAFQQYEELRRQGIRSLASAPLRLEDRVIGVLSAYCDRPQRFSRDDTAFLSLAAELVAVAIENARAHAAAERLLAERSQFLLRVTHNMRAPLAAGLSLLSVVRDGSLGALTPRQEDFLHRIDLRLRNLNQTIGELLTLTRGRDHEEPTPPQRLEPARLAAQLRELFAERAAAKGIALSIAVAAGSPAVAGREEAISQLLENLLSNAVKYTPPGGSIQVSFQPSPAGELRVEVRDSGIGIPAAEQSELFSEFFRASNARKLAEEGTGLGLALVKQAVARHGGRLHLASEEGVGTTVVVDLPPIPAAV